MLDSLNSAESIEGEIRLSMSSSVCSRYFKNDFLRFHHQYPEIKVEITENGTEQMFDKLRKNETDLVFTLDRHIYDSDFIICAEQEEQVHFIAAADNPVADCSWKLSEIRIINMPVQRKTRSVSFFRNLSNICSVPFSVISTFISGY